MRNLLLLRSPRVAADRHLEIRSPSAARARNSSIQGVADLSIAIRLAAFFGNCGILADQDFAIRSAHPDIAPFLSDFENNGTVEFNEFFCVRLARENNF